MIFFVWFILNNKSKKILDMSSLGLILADQKLLPNNGRAIDQYDAIIGPKLDLCLGMYFDHNEPQDICELYFRQDCIEIAEMFQSYTAEQARKIMYFAEIWFQANCFDDDELEDDEIDCLGGDFQSMIVSH